MPKIRCASCVVVEASSRLRFATAEMSPLHVDLLPAVTLTEVHAAAFLHRAYLADHAQPAKTMAGSVTNATARHDGTPQAAAETDRTSG
jgi:hypothetical protein